MVCTEANCVCDREGRSVIRYIWCLAHEKAMKMAAMGVKCTRRGPSSLLDNQLLSQRSTQGFTVLCEVSVAT